MCTLYDECSIRVASMLTVTVYYTTPEEQQFMMLLALLYVCSVYTVSLLLQEIIRDPKKLIPYFTG